MTTDATMGGLPVPFAATPVETTPGSFTLQVVGEIDLHTRPLLDAELLRLLEKQPSELAVDMSGVSFCASTGLGALVELNNRFRTENRTLRILVSPALHRIIDLAGLGTVLPLA